MNAQDVDEVKRALAQLKGNEPKKALSRGINKTMTGVRTDGVKMLTEYYALTAKKIRESWKINPCRINTPSGDVSTRGSYINLIEYGAKQTPSGVSVKVLKKSGRKTVMHAFIGKIKSSQNAAQVYRRKWQDKNEATHATPLQQAMAMKGFIWSKRQKRWIPAKWMDNYYQNTGEFRYRFPVRSLYGPRVQDFLADEQHFLILKKMADERLRVNVAHEVDYLLMLMKKEMKS